MTIERINPGGKSISSKGYNQMAAASEQVQAWQNSFGSKNLPPRMSNKGILIDGYNYSESNIDNFVPVELTDPIPLLTSDDLAFTYGGKRPAFKIKLATKETENFAITQNTIHPETAGPVLLQGITIAQIINSNADHKYVKVNSDGNLESSSTGSCRILWKAVATGTVWAILQLAGGATAGDVYKGYFKVIQTAPNKIKIVDGMDEEADNCWSGYINKIKQDIPVSTELTITADCLVFLKLVAVENPATSFTATFEQAEALPDYVDGTEYSLISRLKFKAPVAPATVGNITDFDRHPVPEHIIVWGTC